MPKKPQLDRLLLPLQLKHMGEKCKNVGMLCDRGQWTMRAFTNAGSEIRIDSQADFCGALAQLIEELKHVP